MRARPERQEGLRARWLAGCWFCQPVVYGHTEGICDECQDQLDRFRAWLHRSFPVVLEAEQSASS